MQHRVATAQSQCLGHIVIGAGAFAIDDESFGWSLAVEVAVIGFELQEPVLDLLLRMGGHKRALALAAYQQIVFRQFVNGFAHRTLADFVAGRQFEFAGNGFAWLPLTALQALQNQRLDLLIKWTEGRRNPCHRSRGSEAGFSTHGAEKGGLSEKKRT